MYKILGTDQKEYGPVSAETIRQWVTERRANAQTMVQAEGSTDWKPLGQFPEFADLLAPPAAAAGARPTAAVPGAPIEGQKKGLAITSLVLGIVSCVPPLGLLTGIPAIITGAIATKRTRSQPEVYGGGGMGVAGIVTGAIGFLLVFLLAIPAAVMLPALARAKSNVAAAQSRAQTIQCVNNLKQIGLAARIYANDNKGVFPKDFVSMANELSTPKTLVCPADNSKTRAESWSAFSPDQNATFIIEAPGMKEDGANANRVYARCPIHDNVCMGDGSVQQRGFQRGRR